MNVEAGGRNIAILAEETASLLGLHSSDRAKIAGKNGSLIAIVNIANRFAKDHVGVYNEISAKIGVAQDDLVEVVAAEMPESLHHVREAIHGKRLRPNEFELVVSDVVERHLSDAEICFRNRTAHSWVGHGRD